MATLGARARGLVGLSLAGLLLGCGLGGMGGELDVTSWPQSGLGPFRLLEPEDAPDLDVPFVLEQPGLDLGEPAAVVPGGGEAGAGAILLWVTARHHGGAKAEGASIYRATAQSLADGAMDAAPALAPVAPWEGGSLRHPTLLFGEPGLPLYVLLYQGADGSVGAVAAADADGLAGAPDRHLLGSAARLGGGAPLGDASAVVAQGKLRLFFVTPDGAAVRRAESDLAAVQQALAGASAGEVPWDLGPVVLRAADFQVGTSGHLVPGAGLSGLSARRVVTPAGRARFDLFLVASAGGKLSVCAASSYDGAAFLAVSEPVLARSPLPPSAPMVLEYAGRALLLLGLQGVQGGIAAGIIP